MRINSSDLRGVVLIALAVLVAAPGATGQKLAKKATELETIFKYDTDESVGYGISVKAPNKWPSIPLQPAEKYIIAKWQYSIDLPLTKTAATVEGGRITTWIERPYAVLVRIPKRGGPTKAPVTGKEKEGVDEEEGEDDDDEPGDEGANDPGDIRKRLEAMGGGQPVARSFKQWVKLDKYGDEDRRWGGTRYVDEEPLKDKKTPGTFYDIITKQGLIPGVEDHVFAYVYDWPDIDETYALIFRISTQNWHKWHKVFAKSAKTFERFDLKKTAKKPTKGVVKDEPLWRAAARAKHEAEVARTEGWRLEETEHYFLKIHTEQKSFVKDVKKRLEAIRRVYETEFPTEFPIEAVSVVRVCMNEREYSSYGGPPGSAGYWNKNDEELVLYRTVNMGPRGWKAVLNHEAFHQYIYYMAGELDPHSWFNEGYGDYFGGAELRGSRFKVKPFDWRVQTIKQAIREETFVPIKEIIRWSQRQYYSGNAGMHYAEGWSIVYFLKHGRRGAKKFDKNWEKILPLYLEVLIETRDQDKAVEAAFAGVDFERFEASWKDFIG